MAKINTISTAPVNEWVQKAPAVCASSAKTMFDEILKQDNRLSALAYKVREELKSVHLEGDTPSTALSLAELLCDLLGDWSDKVDLLECLEALQIQFANGAEKIAA